MKNTIGPGILCRGTFTRICTEINIKLRPYQVNGLVEMLINHAFNGDPEACNKQLESWLFSIKEIKRKKEENTNAEN